MNRGTFSFDVTDKGDLIDGAANVDALRRLWLDRTMIDGSDLGPGNSGDFDFGAWHVGCHIVAAGGVRRASNGQLLWLAISHATQRDDYFASVTSETSSGTRTYQIASPEGRALLIGSTLLGFVEGTCATRRVDSTAGPGRISIARRRATKTAARCGSIGARCGISARPMRSELRFSEPTFLSLPLWGICSLRRSPGGEGITDTRSSCAPS
jgi:hypothetical protein